jgi:hypothetical protein
MSPLGADRKSLFKLVRIGFDSNRTCTGYDVRRERDNIVAVETVSTTVGISMKRREFITLVAGAD